MPGYRRPVSLAVAAMSQAGAAFVPSVIVGDGAAAAVNRCSPGARSLSPDGSRLYPETGNGGYASVHTGVYMVYDAGTNTFLPGNHVTLTDRATQCLSNFSLDFERFSANTADGPDMTVRAVTVDGRPARFAFAQPTYDAAIRPGAAEMMLASASYAVHKHAAALPQVPTQPGTGAEQGGEGA